MVVCFDFDFELIILKQRIDLNIKDVAYSRVKKKGFSLPAVETVKAESFPMECFEKGYIFYQKMVYKSGHLDGGSRFKIFHGSPLPFPSCMLLNCSRYIVWKPRSTREIGNDNF